MKTLLLLLDEANIKNTEQFTSGLPENIQVDIVSSETKIDYNAREKYDFIVSFIDLDERATIDFIKTPLFPMTTKSMNKSKAIEMLSSIVLSLLG